MLDMVVLQIPFASSWVDSNSCEFEQSSPDPFSRKVIASIDPYWIPVPMGAKSLEWVNGRPSVSDIYCPWEKIESSHAGLAVKVFHQGNGFCGWPYIEIKCSPAKLVQGHNIYGFDDLGFAVNNMIWLLNEKYPQLGGGFLESDEIDKSIEDRGSMLDFEKARITELDITYSIRIEDKAIRYAVIDFFRNISKGHTKGRDGYESTAYFGAKTSRLKRNKLYDKLAEVLRDNIERQKKGKKLISDENIYFADGLLRFEGTGKKDWFERRGISTNMIEMVKWFRADKARYRLVFDLLMKDLFDSLDGSKVTVMNDDNVYKQIDSVFGDTRGKTARVFGTYQSIKAVGFDRFKKQHADRTFKRLIKELETAGFSRADICNLHTDNNVVIKLSTIVNLDLLHEPTPKYYSYVNLWEQVA